MFITRAALFFSALVSAAFPAFSQTYPTRPITMIVPFAVGGPTDTIARIMGERMGKTLGQQVIVENVTGAGGSIAVNKVARSVPDGYTVGIGHIGAERRKDPRYFRLAAADAACESDDVRHDQLGI